MCMKSEWYYLTYSRAKQLDIVFVYACVMRPIIYTVRHWPAQEECMTTEILLFENMRVVREFDWDRQLTGSEEGSEYLIDSRKLN